MRGRNISRLFSRNFSNTKTLSSTLETFVWLPAVKKQDRVSGLITSREVISSLEAKRRFAKNERGSGVDPWGHAAARIAVNCQDSSANEELREKIQELAIIHKSVSLKDSRGINSLHAYLSLYPDFDKPHGGSFTELEQREWNEGMNTKDPKVNQGKARSLYLFNKKYTAFNNTHESDILGYGKPDYNQVFSRGLNFVKIVEKCFEMMVPVVRDNTIIMEIILPQAAYYGKAMLEEHRLITKILGNDIQELSKSDKENELIHVCTTANLILFKAGLGDDHYYDLVKEVLKDSPELSHGFPITEFTHAFFKALSRHPDYTNANMGEERDDQTNPRNGVGMK